MADFLKFKKSNCKNCYKCIRHCPVKSIRFSAGQANIVNNECILCGQCFVVCPQNAKEIADDTEKAKILLSGNDPVIASVAPSFIANYNGIGINELENKLKELGFTAAFETAEGATVVKSEYERILREQKPNILISSACHSINLLIQKHYPNELKFLADVISPMQAHSMMIKKKYKNAKTIFIGPCVAKKDEADHYGDIVDIVLTFEELSKMFAEKGITLSKGKDFKDESKARLFPTAGGILRSMCCDEPGYTYMAVDGVENCISALKDIENGTLKNCFIEMSACVGSCIGGPVMEKYHCSPIRDFIEVDSYAGKKDFVVDKLSEGELRKEFENIAKELPYPTETQINAILRQMGKMKPSQELNCGSCGYNTCREKAVAIFQGKADLTMCLPYLKEKAENFSNSIIDNTPNGIILLNENLEVQQINKAACAILNIINSCDVLGEQVVRILDPKEIITVVNDKSSIKDKQKYLAEYNKYVEETIIYDTQYRSIMIILRDITNEETERIKKESITHETIQVADKVVDKQMRIVQEIASLLGETAAETKIALTKLKESVSDE